MAEIVRSIELATSVDHLMVEIEGLRGTSTDPALEPLVNQTANHLKHVTYDFRIAGDSEDYPYELRREHGYPERPTERAISNANQLLDLVRSDTDPSLVYSVPENEAYRQQLQASQNEIMQQVLADSFGAYQEFAARRQADPDNAQFPEFEPTVRQLHYEMLYKPEVQEACEQSPLLSRLRAQLTSGLQEKIDDANYGYRSTILAIEEAVAFFDIVVRTNHPDSPPLFHSGYFEYNWHSFVEDDEHTVFPTMASVNSTDLLKLRGVPVGLIGVFTNTMTVDGYPQTPYEFFHHDIDHSRRMHLETLLGIEREGVTSEQYAKDATRLIHDVLLPAVDLTGISGEDERDHRIAMRMILFEIMHEDAYDPVRDTIADAILRDPKERMPFERTVGKHTVEYYMTNRATVLAHVYRKLTGRFYDFPEKRSTSLGSDFVRTRLAIASAAKDLYRLVSDDPITDQSLLQTCQDLVSTDENFSQAFLNGLSGDIKQYGTGRHALRLGIARPLGVAAAVRKSRKLKQALAGDDGRIHSLFGYSALGYEDPELLDQVIEADLRRDFDPTNTIIAIGATPYGIGRAYEIAKDLGYRTLGIVASTALGKNEDAANGVDDFVIVRDQGWGGFKYSQESGGLLSPTTRVFVGASDSVAAYGGGGITAVTLEEMKRRNKQVHFTPFDMNHRKAEIGHAQSGATDKPNYAGPAHAKWQELNT